jgi:hypothetical protein
MPRGGRRPGSGRKPGSPNRKRGEVILRKAYESGKIMPLELMISEMRRLFAEGTPEALREARMLAQAAAPYCHPRLQAILASTTSTDRDTLSQLLRQIDGKTTGIAQGLLDADDADGESALEAEQLIHLRH